MEGRGRRDDNGCTAYRYEETALAIEKRNKIRVLIQKARAKVDDAEWKDADAAIASATELQSSQNKDLCAMLMLRDDATLPNNLDLMEIVHCQGRAIYREGWGGGGI